MALQHGLRGVDQLYFLRDEGAVAAVEFALLLPFLLVLLIAGNEITQLITIQRKISQTAYTLSDLTSQSTSMQVADISNILDASSAVMMPFNATGAQMVLSAVTLNGSAYRVAWSRARNAAAWTVGVAPPATMVIPKNLVASGSQIIVAQVTYNYTTPFTAVLTSIWGSGTIALGEVNIARPRYSTVIACTDC